QGGSKPCAVNTVCASGEIRNLISALPVSLFGDDVPTPAAYTVALPRSPGKGPTTSTPSVELSSGLLCTAMSTSPLTKSVPTKPAGGGNLLLALTSAAIPKRSITLAKCTPLAPPAAGSLQPTARAASNALLSDSAEEMSGLGAPRFTPIANTDFARVASEPAAILPSLVRLSMLARDTTRTSGTSPSWALFANAEIRPQVMLSLLPDSFSNFDPNSSSALLTPIVL